jgi:CHASE2 domain-containing sensor protein
MKEEAKNKLDAVAVSALLLLIILITASGIVTLQPLSLLCYVMFFSSKPQKMEKERVLVSPLLFYALPGCAVFDIRMDIY